MENVKWIKLSTSIFDNRKIKQIRSLPEGDTIVVIWLKLLCLAGNINDGGLIYLTKEIPYTEQMLAAQFEVPLQVMQLSLNTFERFEMIDIIDNILFISNWERYQNIEGMERIREQNKLRKRRQREREKLLIEDSHVMSRDSHATEEDIEEEKEIERDKNNIISPKGDIADSKTDYADVVNYWNEHVLSLPKVIKLTDTRKKAIRTRIKTYGKEEIFGAFDKTENSDFLSGRTGKFTASFDWVMTNSNFVKVIEGNYDNRGGGSSAGRRKDDGGVSTSYATPDINELYRQKHKNDK